MRAAVFLALLSIPAAALAQKKTTVFVVGAIGNARPSTRAIYARKGQIVTLHLVVKTTLRGKKAHYFTNARSLRIRGRRIPKRKIRPISQLEARLQWYRIEPHPHHVNTPVPNQGNPAYSNAILFGPRHGRWLGYDTIEYHDTLIPGATRPWLTLSRVTPSHPKVNVHNGLGTMRYRVEVELNGQRYSSAQVDSALKAGISRRVMRVSFRGADDFVGHLTSYYNVPNVFGSAGGKSTRHQTELYQGADCADVIIGATRRAGARLPYSSVAGLKRHAKAITPKLWLDQSGIYELADGQKGPPLQLRFGDQIRRGDIMLIDYAGFDGSPRSWDHVAVVSFDQGVAGRFDPEDRIMHMGYLYGLTETPAHSEGPAVVQFLRFKRSVRRAMK